MNFRLNTGRAYGGWARRPEAEIYLYDTLPGGAGFAQRVGLLGLAFFEDALRFSRRALRIAIAPATAASAATRTSSSTISWIGIWRESSAVRARRQAADARRDGSALDRSALRGSRASGDRRPRAGP